MTDSDTTGKRDTQKMQRAAVDALEDVKAQEIKVFDTGRLSSLFERVIIASGTSNRQTKALAASVRDKVREAGFPKPRIEGEDNGEWIIIDCGAVVVHVMQPSIRQYYNLEEIWGEKPVRLKFGAARPLVKAEVPTAKNVVGKTRRASPGGADKTLPKAEKAASGAASKASARRVAAPAASLSARPPSGATGFAKKVAKPSVKRSSSATKSVVTKVVVQAAAKRSPAKPVASTTKAAAPRRAAVKKAAPGKA